MEKLCSPPPLPSVFRFNDVHLVVSLRACGNISGMKWLLLSYGCAYCLQQYVLRMLYNLL